MSIYAFSEWILQLCWMFETVRNKTLRERACERRTREERKAQDCEGRERRVHQFGVTQTRPRLQKGWLGDTCELSCPQIFNRLHFILFRSRQLNWAQHKLFPFYLCFSLFFFLLMSLSTLNHSQIKVTKLYKTLCFLYHLKHSCWHDRSHD